MCYSLQVVFFTNFPHFQSDMTEKFLRKFLGSLEVWHNFLVITTLVSYKLVSYQKKVYIIVKLMSDENYTFSWRNNGNVLFFLPKGFSGTNCIHCIYICCWLYGFVRHILSIRCKLKMLISRFINNDFVFS